MYKNIEERKLEVNDLTSLQLTIQYEEIKELFKLMQIFIKEGNKIKVNIPFKMIERRIKGELLPGKREKSWIKLVMMGYICSEVMMGHMTDHICRAVMMDIHAGQS